MFFRGTSNKKSSGTSGHVLQSLWLLDCKIEQPKMIRCFELAFSNHVPRISNMTISVQGI